MNRIDALFSRLRSEKRKALMPFVTAGDPDLETTRDLIAELAARGANLIEIGIPYSDPIADGPVISASYTRAIQHGIKLDAIFAMIRDLRSRALVDIPLVTMVSYAIVLRHGLERFVADAAEAGVDGLIVPDLPVEESRELRTLAGARDLKFIQLVTPTTPRERALQIDQTTSGFLYYVSVAGITGERRDLPPDLAENVAWLRSRSKLPICIGFGISSADHVRQLAPIADGLIVGSALVRRIHDFAEQPRSELVRAAGAFVAELAEAL